MRFRGLDLNLLATLAILIEERSVSRAAARLNLSQPAISAMLARLRHYFGDPLLVTHGRRMFPTSLAEALSPQIAAVLASVSTLVDNAKGFDPELSERTFRLAASDYIGVVLLQPVMRRLERTAPGVRIVVELPTERSAARLEDGSIDLLLTLEEFASARHPLEPLFSENHLVVGWNRNTALASPISEDDFLSLRHVSVLLGTDTRAAFADRQLEHLGKKRRIDITVPSFAAVPWMLVHTMRIALMHERLATLVASSLPLTTSPLPFVFAPMIEVVQFHAARAGDAGLRWLCNLLHDAAGAAHEPLA